MKRIFLLAISFMLFADGFANNIQVTNIVYDNAAGTVTFNISWENSWRVSTAPNNWDAAWVFVKRQNCANPFWQQQYLSAAGHSTSAPLEIKTVPDSVGVFIQRSGNGNGNIASTSVTLKLGNVPVPLNEWDFKVFAIEMVYIPQSSFQLGDGGGAGNTIYGFQDSSSLSPYTVTSEAAINFGTTSGKLYSATTGSYGPTGNVIPATFPKGFAASYCMKYEISQGQYCDFLNSIASDQATNRYPGYNGASRHTILGTWPVFTVTTPNRACNFISWADMNAYLDWSGLAPMTEMEYEKICRGNAAPVLGEFAWGTSLFTLFSAASLLNDGTAQETTTAVPTVGAGLVNGGNAINTVYGPMRCGFAAKNATNRLQAGASYYGVMEMTGNLWERVIGIHTNGISFEGMKHGDGTLTVTGAPSGAGFSNVSGWLNQTSITDVAGAGASIKGGSTGDNFNGAGAGYTHVSSRYYTNNASASRSTYTGGRGVRRSFN